MPETKRIPVQKIYEFIKDVFLKLGAPENDAKICADVLIFADLSGIESHGIGRLYYYYERIKAGVQINTGLQKNINIIINELNLDRSYFGF